MHCHQAHHVLYGTVLTHKDRVLYHTVEREHNWDEKRVMMICRRGEGKGKGKGNILGGNLAMNATAFRL